MNIAGILKGVGFGDLIEKGGKVIDDLVVTERELKMEELQLAREQIRVNKVEASHRSWWTAGWRPFVGWTCGAGLLYAILVGPVAEQMFGLPMARLDTALLLTVLGGMLGMGALRTGEKLKGAAR